MEVTWQLKPGLTWHDGAPLTANEFAFTDRLFKDPGWSLEWVGLGPYRLTNRIQATQMEAEAFDGFVWGRPKIDRLLDPVDDRQ